MTTQNSSYVPGMCNINQAEIAYRKKAMLFGAGLSALLFIVLLILSAPWWLVVILLFIPVYIAAIGVLQVRNRFCVSYGSKGKQNADEGSAEAHAVVDKEALAADKAKTRKMNTQAFGMTLAVLIVAGFISYLI